MIGVAKMAKGMLDNNERFLWLILEGMTVDDLHRQPTPETNPIGWTIWHITRSLDNRAAVIDRGQQLWIGDGWHARFGRPADPDDRGSGHTLEQVAAFRTPDAATLADYYRATRKALDSALENLQESHLDREIENTRGRGTLPLSEFLESSLVHAINHTGQAGYARGLIHGKGWLPF